MRTKCREPKASFAGYQPTIYTATWFASKRSQSQTVSSRPLVSGNVRTLRMTSR